MRRVANALKKNNYDTVSFSAWQYPTAPEVWIHLYETFAEAAYPKGFLTTGRRLIRTGLAKNGPWPVLSAAFALALAVFPKSHLVILGWGALGQLLPWLGLGGVILLLSFVLGIKKTVRRLNKDFLSATRHIEKLGLQATIGNDLRVLLEGWIPKERFCLGWKQVRSKVAKAKSEVTVAKSGLRAWFQRNFAGLKIWKNEFNWSGLGCLLFYFGCVVGMTWGSWEWLHFGPAALRTPPSVARLVCGLLFAIGVAAPFWVLWRRREPSRVLLVVDDLDRCKPEHLLSVMESIKLLLENPKISERVQVAMLIEEDILTHAILKEYGELKGLTKVFRFSPERLVRENREKLFNAHLRLPPLSEKDILEILDKLTGRERIKVESQRFQSISTEEKAVESNVKRTEQELKERGTKIVLNPGMPAPIGPRTERDSKRHIPLTPEEEALRQSKLKEQLQEQNAALAKARAEREALEKKLGVSAAQQTDTDANSRASNFVFEEEEERLLKASIPRLRKASNDQPLGPRSIRAFVFRYQLARLILNRLRVPWTPEQLIEDLVCSATGQDYSVKSDISDEVRRVVEQVS
jgi:hypothetical protein